MLLLSPSQLYIVILKATVDVRPIDHLELKDVISVLQVNPGWLCRIRIKAAFMISST